MCEHAAACQVNMEKPDHSADVLDSQTCFTRSPGSLDPHRSYTEQRL